MSIKKDEKRTRRDKETIENNILNATKSLIEANGFSHVTVSAIVQKADIEPAVFYNRYKDIDDLFDKITREYDYWVNDSVSYDPVNLPPAKNWENHLTDLIDSINNNTIMQQLLAWELTEDNRITRRTTENRERFTKEMREYFANAFKDKDDNFAMTSAIFISGIYYLTLFKKRSTFFDIDFNKKATINDLKENIRILIKKIYGNTVKKEEPDTLSIIAKRMLDKGMDKTLITEITGLSDKKIDLLENNIPPKAKKRGRPKKSL